MAKHNTLNKLCGYIDQKEINRFLRHHSIDQYHFELIFAFLERSIEASSKSKWAEIRAARSRRKEKTTKPIHNKSKYIEYLNSPEWKELRLKALEFYGNCCGVCGSKYSLHIHHKSYKNIYKEQLSDLMILCEECHQKEHGRKFTYGNRASLEVRNH